MLWRVKSARAARAGFGGWHFASSASIRAGRAQAAEGDPPAKATAKLKARADASEAWTAQRRSGRSARLLRPLALLGRGTACGRSSPASASIVWVGAHLPPIQSLEIPKRPPTIQIARPRRHDASRRAATWAAPTSRSKELPPYLPQAFIAIEDRRFYSHFGVDPIGIVRAVVGERAAPRRVAGRLDASPSSSPRTCS